MKIIPLFFRVTTFLFLTSCVTTNKNSNVVKSTPFFNQKEFTGLVSLGKDVSSVRLDYVLDSVDGKELHLTSCIEVNAVNEVQTSQYHLLRLMKANCMSVGYYFDALKIGKVPSFLPENLNNSFIRSLSAKAIPNLGGQSLDRNGTLAQAEKGMKVLSANNKSMELSLADNLVVKYLIIARGDFNHELLKGEHALSITFDNGKEFAKHDRIADKLNTEIYFAKPYHSWERGTNENTNGLIRQFLPKSKRLDNVPDEVVQEIENNLNNRPRKVLGFKTPLEVKSSFHCVALRI